MKKLVWAAAAAAAVLLSGCGDNASDKAGKETAAQGNASAQVVIYSNADEEAQQAIRHALDNNGFKGRYLLQAFGTSELSGKLIAEGKNIEADVVTLSTYYLESLQKSSAMFQKLAFTPQTIEPSSEYYALLLAQNGALFVNTQVLEADKLPRPTAIADLAKPVYAGHISVPDIMGSSTAWLMTQALIAAYGEAEGAKIAQAIEKNAGPHLEMSGSGPLKKIRAGEVAVGFGVRHQAVLDKAKGLPIDYVDPVEGNFDHTESAAVIDKGDKTNPDAQKVVETIIRYGRSELLKNYPVALYKGETVDAANRPANPKKFPEPLTLELLQKHQKLVKGE